MFSFTEYFQSGNFTGFPAKMTWNQHIQNKITLECKSFSRNNLLEWIFFECDRIIFAYVFALLLVFILSVVFERNQKYKNYIHTYMYVCSNQIYQFFLKQIGWVTVIGSHWNHFQIESVPYRFYHFLVHHNTSGKIHT